MANALAASASPYLRQHAGNPVDWRPWGDDAFAEARRRDVPVLVSIGYSTCHWCHVMAHECFEDAATAALMNRELVCIKVDREEHPEVDAIYMDAVQGLTGHGGWPLNAFTDHQGRPFHACTYLPRPRWGQLVEHLGGLWRSDRARLDQAAGEITAWLRRQDAANPAALPDDILDRLDAQVAQAFDEQDPGLAWSPERAPKFPPSALLGLLVDLGGERLARAEAILAAMQDGGLHDRVGGGFHRYSVDAAWRLPHFEKMLYDNAQLMGVYARAGARLGRGDFLATAINAADYVLRDLRVETADAGVFAGYAAAEDADDAGGEGSFYAWSPAQLAAVLGEETGAVLAREWDLRPGRAEIGPGGHAEPVISHIPHPRAAGIPAGEVGQRRRAAWEAHLPVLRAARAARPRPGRDDKVLTDQNGLLLAGLAWVARLGGQERHRQAVAELAAALRRRQGPDGLLRLPGRPAYITDYGALASGLLAAFDLLGDAALVDAAMAVVDEAAARLGDGAGGFHTTPAGRTDLVRRGREPLDNAWPAGQSQLAWAAERLAHIDGAPRWGDLADGVLASAGAVAVQAPVSSATLLAAWQARRTGGVLVVAGGGASAVALLAAARALPIADAIVPAGIARPWACLEGRRDEVSAAVHRCRQGACTLPVRDAAGLAALV